MPQLATGRARLEDFSPEQRLNGWKEIAAYLVRGERTVKRWESDRGLPIHRPNRFDRYRVPPGDHCETGRMPEQVNYRAHEF